MDPIFPALVIGVIVIVVAAVLVFDRATSGQHHWFRGNDWAIPMGDRENATRHAWRPGAGDDTIRVDVLVQRLAAEAQAGRHHLTDPVPADEGLADDTEVIQRLYTHFLPPPWLAS